MWHSCKLNAWSCSLPQHRVGSLWPCFVLLCLAFLCIALPCLVLPSFPLHCLVLSCIPLPCPGLPGLAVPCHAWPSLVLPSLLFPHSNFLRVQTAHFLQARAKPHWQSDHFPNSSELGKAAVLLVKFGRVGSGRVGSGRVRTC